MSKVRIVVFQDGAKEVKVGDVCAYMCRGRLSESKIKSIGNKFVTLEDGAAFYMDSGLIKSEYTNSYGRLHSSAEALRMITQNGVKLKECSSQADKISKILSNLDRKKLSGEQIEKIETLLKEVEGMIR
jgi:hypothetical protein